MAGQILLRRFTVLWTALTLAYLAAVAHRTVGLHAPPGLPTLAAFSAVLAVWLELFVMLTGRTLLDFGVASALFASVTLNTAILVRAALHDRALILTRTGFTVLLLIVLIWKTNDLLHRFRITGKR